MEEPATRPEVGIVGFGHVGQLMRRIFPDALVYDKFRPEVSAARDEVAACRFAFVCVPTDMGPDGTADLSDVEEVAGWLRAQALVLRSTVPPGTSRRLAGQTGHRVVFWPEYCGEWNYVTPWEHSPEGWPSVILGGEADVTREVVELLAPRLGPLKTYRQVSSEAAELCKYMENAWLAAQVIFSWQFRLLADAAGADFWEVRELWGLDPRVSKAHTAALLAAPGFGGKCLPKDLSAITAYGAEAGVDVSFLQAIGQFNRTLRAGTGPPNPGVPGDPGDAGAPGAAVRT
jgi:UDPglucose 6-dehydrogenase